MILITTLEELKEKRDLLKQQIWTLEQDLRNKSYVSSVDFQSMYPSVIRLLNASIESLVGFLDDDPIAYRKLGLSKIIEDAKEASKDLMRGSLKDSRFVKFVGNQEEKLSLRKELYAGKYEDVTIEDITETPFERYFLACVGIFDPDEVFIKFQGEDYSVTELRALFKVKDYSVSGSGAVFSKTVNEKGDLGLIPTYLTYLFEERKRVKRSAAVNFRNKLLLQKFKNAALSDGIL